MKMKEVYLTVEYTCSNCSKVSETTFDKIDMMRRGRHEACECGAILWLHYKPLCPHCKDSLEDVELYFKEDDLKNKGKHVNCPNCNKIVWFSTIIEKTVPIFILK